MAGLLGTEPVGVVRADEHLLALLLAAEPELAADLCEHALAPLHALPAGAGARGEQTLRAWLDAHGDVSVAAATLHVHPQTVRYRLAALREAFGDALDDPGARLELAIALRMTHVPGVHPSRRTRPPDRQVSAACRGQPARRTGCWSAPASAVAVRTGRAANEAAASPGRRRSPRGGAARTG